MESHGGPHGMYSGAFSYQLKNFDVAVRREMLQLITERAAVHAMRSAMDFHDERILLALIEPGRLDDPAFDLGATARRIPDRLRCTEMNAVEHVGVDARQPRDRLRLSGFEAEPRTVRRLHRIRDNADPRQVTPDR